MNYDLDFRYRRALQPDGLRTIQHATTAVADAITDARNAGVNPDNDPAIVLLARHLGRLAQGLDPETLHDEDTFLRRQCLNRIAELKAKPALLAIARRGVDYDPQSKTAFHNEAKRALRALANHLGLAPDSYNLRSNKAGPAVSGEVTLHTETLLRPGLAGALLRWPRGDVPTLRKPSGLYRPPQQLLRHRRHPRSPEVRATASPRNRRHIPTRQSAPHLGDQSWDGFLCLPAECSRTRPPRNISMPSAPTLPIPSAAARPDSRS